MSCGWSAGDIVSAALLLKKVGKALKDSSGSAGEFQDTVAFLESLDKTLAGLKNLLDNNAELKWQSELVGQAGRLQDAVGEFRGRISKYEAALGAESERKKALRIPKEIQFALSDRVKELKGAMGVRMSVLQNMILMQTLTSVLSLDESSSVSQCALQQRTERILAHMPLIQEKLEDIDAEMKTEIEELKQIQRELEGQMRADLEDVKALTRGIQNSQGDVATRFNQATLSQSEAWTHLQRSIQALQECTSQILQVLSKNQTDIEDTKSVVSKFASSQILASAVQVLGCGIASGTGAMVAIASSKRPPNPGFTEIVPHGHSSLRLKSGSTNESAWDVAYQAAKASSDMHDKTSQTTNLLPQASQTITGFRSARRESDGTGATIDRQAQVTKPVDVRHSVTKQTARKILGFIFSRANHPTEFFCPGRVFQIDRCHFMGIEMRTSSIKIGSIYGFIVIGKDIYHRHALCYAVRGFGEDDTLIPGDRKMEIQLAGSIQSKRSSEAPLIIHAVDEFIHLVGTDKLRLMVNSRVRISYDVRSTNLGFLDQNATSFLADKQLCLTEEQSRTVSFDSYVYEDPFGNGF